MGRLGPSTHAISRRLLPAFGRSTQEDFDRLNKADNQDGQDEEGQGAPLVQGGEGQGAQEVLRAHRKASRSSKEGSRRGETQVRAHRITKGQKARTEECPQRIKSLRIHPCLP